MRECPLRGLTPRAEIENKSQKVSDSHRNDVSPLTQGLRYRAACDESSVDLQTTLNNLDDWAAKWQMEIAYNKSQAAR